MAVGELSKRKVEIEQWVKQAQDGDHDAFSKVYDIFVDPIYRYVYYRVKHEDVEDLVETVFLKVWRALGNYKVDKKASFSAWIFRIAHNLVVDYYRGKKDREFDELSMSLPDDKREHNPIKTTERSLQNDSLKVVIAKLRKPYQDIIIHKFMNGFSNKEISEIMNRSEGSVRILQFRALKALKFKLEDMGIKYQF